MSFTIPGEHYIVVTEHDLPVGTPVPAMPLAWETPLDGKASTKEAAQHRANMMRNRYGRARIARLVFED